MRKLMVVFGVVIMLWAANGLVAFAQGSSTNYRIDESFVGPGGNLDSGSTNYKTESGQQTLGGNGGGESGSTNYSSKAGAPTASDPALTCTVNSSTVNFGALSIATTSTGTATFSVLNYTSYGYVVQIVGSPPATGAHALTAMSSTGPATTGTEQFGINLVANTSPTTFGANPAQIPDSSFSFGAAASNYNTANNYRYVEGETIASATKTSGETDYTISYIADVSNTTPGGTYSGGQTLVCVGTY